MAKLSQLAPALAAVLGIDERSMAHRARILRDAGLVATGGRGPGGAEMGDADAANLLLGALASDTILESPDAVRAFRRLELSGRVYPAMPDEIGAIGAPRCTLGDAVETLIRAARRGALKAMIRRTAKHLAPAGGSDRDIAALIDSHGGVRVEIIRPECFSRISAATVDGEAVANFWIPRRSILAGDLRRFRSGPVGDRKVKESVTHRTFEVLGEILGPVE